jgi:hypothetical protein
MVEQYDPPPGLTTQAARADLRWSRVTTPSAVSPEARAALDRYLHACERLPTGTRAPDPPADITAFPEAERGAMVADLIAEHRAGRYGGPAYFGAERAWGQLLVSLEPLSEDVLCVLLRAIGGTGAYLCGYPWRYAWDEAKKRIVAHGISRELHGALRAMQPAMRVHQSDKNAAIAIDRALYFESFSKLDPTRDAGHLVLAGLRAMSPADRGPWEALVVHGMDASRAEPKDSWKAKAEKLSKKVRDLDATLAAWLRDVGALPTLAFSAAGADVLRGLVWLRAPRPRPPAAIVSLAAREWKRRKAGEHAWTPRHDRMVGALAWAAGIVKPAKGAAILDALAARFGKTTAKYAIDLARTAVKKGA